MKKLKLAACGIDCNECGSYKVTATKDLEAAEALVDWYRSMGWIGESEGAEAVISKNPLCKGCWDSTDDCFFKCGGGNCDFRVCCKERQINHCGECSDFPCERYNKFASANEFYQKAKERLIVLRDGD